MTVSSKSDLQEAFSVYEELRTINASKIITLKLFLKQSLASNPSSHTPSFISTQNNTPPSNNVTYLPSTPTSGLSSIESEVPDRPQHHYSRTPPRDSPLFSITPPPKYPDYTPSPKQPPPTRTLSSPPPPLRTPPPTPPDSPREHIGNSNHANGTPNNPPARDFSAYMHPVNQPPLPQIASNPHFTAEEDMPPEDTRPRSASRFHAEIQHALPDKPKPPPLEFQNPSPNPNPPRNTNIPSLLAEHSEPFCAMGWQRGQLIGRGGYGSVYLGLNKATGELLAVKQLDLDNMDDPKFRAVCYFFMLIKLTLITDRCIIC